jgi:hypothetical protein
MLSPMTILIKETPIGGSLKEFLGVGSYVYRDDPHWVRPLDMDLKQRLGLKNPFFEHGEGVILTAHRNGFCVGRATAQIDRLHLERYKDDVGFFGFLDTIDDAGVVKALLERAGQWLKDRGMKRIRGPVSLSLNEECGCLVDGFDTPPMVMMPHHLPYQGGLIEQAGFEKCKDLFAWRYRIGEVPARAQRAHDEIAGLPEVRFRNGDLRNIEAETRVIMDVFNDAWQDNWGFVPATEAELRKMAADLKLIVAPELVCIAEIDGYPAAVALALPNINEVIADLDGKLFPTGALKLLWRLKVARPRTARLMILGIRKQYRHVRKYAALSAFLYTKMNEAGRRLGLEWGELSWTLEENGPVNVAIKMMGGTQYKRYRIYEKGL